MSVVTASRGEMMQVTPDAARARPKRTFYLSAAALAHKVGIYWKKRQSEHTKVSLRPALLLSCTWIKNKCKKLLTNLRYENLSHKEESSLKE